CGLLYCVSPHVAPRSSFRFLYSFFFSSRIRHTRFSRDWSSDVCSSDLLVEYRLFYSEDNMDIFRVELPVFYKPAPVVAVKGRVRSEERRVGKECRTRC